MKEKSFVSSNLSEDLVSSLKLQAVNSDLTKQNTSLSQEIETLKHNIAIFQRALFGKKSEKLNLEDIEQLKLLFDEAEVSADTQAELGFEDDDDEDDFSKPKKKPGRRPLPKDLPRETIIYDLAEDEKVCSCGCILSKIGEDKSEQLERIPATYKVIENVRLKYACKSCEDTIKRAAAPIKPLPKSIATASFLAYVIVSKFADHLPLYRISMMLKRSGIDIGRATLSNWVLACGTSLAPLILELQKDIIASDYVASDETTVNVLDSDTKKSYMWVHMSGDRQKRAVVFDYHASRAGTCATSFLKGFKGAHQCDAYSGYNKLHKSEGVFCVACWAHARRKFYEITKKVKTPGVAHRMVWLIKKLYKIEKEARDRELTPPEITKLRHKKAKPVLVEIKKFLDEQKGKVPPQNPLGKAIAYSLNQWDDLNVYITDGRLRIDNNDSERAIKPFAVGRKNWLFSATTRGANASATLFSLIETCKVNNINPYEYLRYVLVAMRTAETEDDIKQLLPYNVDMYKLSQ